jgi:hypothetical protein
MLNNLLKTKTNNFRIKYPHRQSNELDMTGNLNKTTTRNFKLTKTKTECDEIDLKSPRIYKKNHTNRNS